MESSQNFTSSGTDNKNDGLKLRRPRISSRRHLSKSEPAGQDDMNDPEDQFMDDLGESQPLLGSGYMASRAHSQIRESH